MEQDKESQMLRDSLRVRVMEESFKFDPKRYEEMIKEMANAIGSPVVEVKNFIRNMLFRIIDESLGCTSENSEGDSLPNRILQYKVVHENLVGLGPNVLKRKLGFVAKRTGHSLDKLIEVWRKFLYEIVDEMLPQ